MARSRINNPTDDLITDSGAVLFSFVKGEQLEFPITLTFIEDVRAGYTYEAVIVEGYNVADQEEPPTSVKPVDPVKTTLVVRVPSYIGVFDPVELYFAEDIVSYNGLYYRRLNDMVEAGDVPGTSIYWEETTLNKIYVQFPSTIASTWAVAPTVNVPVYGFFELRVTEPDTVAFVRTWKPVRGMVEILFSPTDIVPDV